ncbi:MAG TPA: ATPase [Anaeromyxobacteraceae bacterium]|nr:ATPase [Anaeromyxobacteraceae bacterium]
MILPMAKLQVLGPRRLLADVLAFLQEQGVLDLRSPPVAGDGPRGRALRLVPLREGEHAAEAVLTAALEGSRRLLAALPPPRRAEPEPLPDVESPAFTARLAALEAERLEGEQRVAALREERRLGERYGRLLVALAPLQATLPGGGEPFPIGLVMRRDPRALAALGAEVERIAGGDCSVQSRPAGGDQLAVLVAVPRAHARTVQALLFERGVAEIRLPARYEGQPLVEALRLLVRREREIPAELARAEGALSLLSGRVAPGLRAAAADARARLARLGALARCGETRHAFVVTGWAPRAAAGGLERALAERFSGAVVAVAHDPDPEGGDDVPVVLGNPPWIRPFERLLALVPPPRYGSVDPTPWLAFFFPLLFGLVLGDAAFGVLGAALSLVALRRGWGGATGRDLSVIALACSLSALLFGLLYGEALGDLGARLGLRPILLHRRGALLPFLGIAVGVGVLHVGVGTVIGLVHSFRCGHVREGIERLGRLVLLAGATLAGLAVAGVLPAALRDPGLWAAGAGALLSLAGGPMALLELALSLGNVLSYSRLMALGIASAMLAEVANHLAATVRPAALGVSLAVLLHAVNFTLGLASPLIASLRLHYVEFFEKFYEGGGKPYRPFALQGS